MKRVGIQVGASTPASELGDVAAEVERLGYGELWLAEDYFEKGGIASAGVALSATDRIPVGLGVVAASVRHPAVTAMEFATLGGAYPGRFRAGIGHGGAGWLRQMGLEAPSPLAQLREVVGSVRRLMAGETVTQNGSFELDQVRLTHAPRSTVPIYLGVHGPASLRLSGELAHGTLLGWFSSPSYVSWARDRIDEGRARDGRTDPHDLVALCVLAISDDDPDGARREVGAWARPVLASMIDSPQIEVSGVRDELASVLGRDAATSQEPLPDEVLDELVAAGTASTCRAMIDRLIEAGADRVVLVPNPAGFRTTTAMVEQIQAASLMATQP